MNAKTNSMKFGTLLGFVIPIVAFICFYLFNLDRFKTFSGFFNFLMSAEILSALVSLCLIPNLVLFFVFLKANSLLSARGVILATFVFALIVVITYYLM